MSLPHAILGFLREQPLTGYALKTQRFDVSVANFWPADQAQIYRTLDRLARLWPFRPHSRATHTGDPLTRGVFCAGRHRAGMSEKPGVPTRSGGRPRSRH